MPISLRSTRPDDVEFVLAAERSPDARPWITLREREEHLAAIAWEEADHLIVEADGEPVGFALLFGVGSRHRSMEIRTIVISRPGEGVGREALRLIIDRAFAAHGSHRVWLDVIDHNERARRAYAAVGFKEEGALRECWLNEEGRFETLLIASILEAEWPASAPPD